MHTRDVTPTWRAALVLAGTVIVASWHASPAAAQLPKGSVEVGRTRDACAGGNLVRFNGRAGEVSIAANQSRIVELPALQKELIWYCGGSRERCANNQAFNWVLCERAGNGAIQWVFYKAP
jgi:hypothetical protein